MIEIFPLFTAVLVHLKTTAAADFDGKCKPKQPLKTIDMLFSKYYNK